MEADCKTVFEELETASRIACGWLICGRFRSAKLTKPKSRPEKMSA